MSHLTLGGNMTGIEQNADMATSGVTSGVRAGSTNIPISARFLVSVGSVAGPVTLTMRSEIAGSAVTLKGGLTAMGYRSV